MTEPAGERRFVAILFAEYPGLPAALEADGVEEGAVFADGFFRRLRAAVEAHGGVVDKFSGDGLMAVFGAPVAHGDDAARAVLAALDLRQQAGELGFRAGVNAGEVLWAGIAGEKATAMGDAVNVAQRLQGAAAPGQIVVAASVESLARRRARFVASGRMQVRGRVEPVETFVCTGKREGGTGAFAGLDLRLCGREEEMARVAAAGGRGRFVWIEGEAGIGKTRLLSELRERAASQGWTAWGRAAEGGGLPLAAPGRALRQAARRDGATDLVSWIAAGFAPLGRAGMEEENLAHLVALSIGEPVPGARVAVLEPERRRLETLYAWERWLRLRTAAGPVALFLDDLHAADPDTRALVTHLGARLRDIPFSVIAAARPGAAAPAGFESITLNPLDAASSAELASLAFKRAASPDLLRFVADRSGGNPFAILELARHIEGERLADGEPLVLIAPVEGIPRGLQPLLQARLDGLGAGMKESLKAASVLGRTFWRGLLQRVAGVDAAASIPAAERLGIVLRVEDSTLAGDEEYAFKDGLLQNAAYALLPKKDRSRLHRAAAADLEALPAAGRRAVALAAGHRESAGEPVAASALWVRAGKIAYHAGGSAEGLACAERARLADDTPDARLLAARCLANVYRYAEAADVADSVCKDRSSTTVQVMDARLVVANAEAARGNLELAIRVSNEILASNPAPAVEIQALHTASFAAYHIGRMEQSQAQVLRILELFDLNPEAQSSIGRLDARSLLAQIYLRTGRVDESLRELGSLAADSRESESPGIYAMVLINIGNVRFLRGEIDAARAAYEEALAVSRRVGDRVRVTAALQNLSNIRCACGDFRGALEADLEVLRMRREVGDERMMGSTLVNVASSRLQLGDVAGAERDMREAIRSCRATHNSYDEAMALTYLAEITGRSRREVEAAEALGQALAIAEPGGFESLVAAVLRLRGFLSLDRDPAAAERDLLGALERARTLHDPRVEALSMSALAILRARTGRGPEAADLLAKALALASGATACPERLQVLEDAAEAHLARRDAAAARAAIEEGREIARSSGAESGLRRFEALAGRLAAKA